MLNSMANWMTVATTADDPLAKYEPGMATRKTKSTSRVQKNTLSFPQFGGFAPEVLPNGISVLYGSRVRLGGVR